MTESATSSVVAAALANLGADLDRLADAYRRLAAHRTPSKADGPASVGRLAAIVEWRRAYDALHGSGVRILAPDGSIVEIDVPGGRIRLRRTGATGETWAIRPSDSTDRKGPPAARFPWVRVV